MTPRVVYDTALDAFRAVCPDPELYLAPRSRLASLRRLVDCPLIALEDVTETDTRLRLAELVQPGIRMVYDRSARYYRVDNDKARVLSRLAEIGRVSLVDIVPFYEHRQHLYMTWRYIDRTILGYQHHYAFAGGHWEATGNGAIVHSLDERLLAGKIAPHVARCSTPWLRPARRVVADPTLGEAAQYASERERLFAKYKTPQPILTRLADVVHAFESRRATVASLLRSGDSVVCNIGSFTDRYKAPGVNVGTYAKPPRPPDPGGRLVFAEPPIVNTFHRIDIQSAVGPDVEIVEVTGGCKVDTHLTARVGDELIEIARFLGELRARLSATECA